MDNIEKRKRLQERIAKAEAKALKGKDKIKELKQKLKDIDKEEAKLTKKQETTVKILHGVACMHLMKEWPELTEKIKDYLEKNVTSDSRRRLLGLPVISQSEKKPGPIIHKPSELFRGWHKPVPAQERIDLVVPYPEPQEEREKAKAAGAKWDSLKRCWYVSKGNDLKKFERWLPQDRNWLEYAINTENIEKLDKNDLI